MEETTPKNTNLNRREALKAILAASGALVAAASLPGRWSKPMVEAGVIPAHAQGSLPDFTVTVLEACRDLRSARIGYTDPAGLVTNGDHVVVYIQIPCDTTIYDGTVGGILASGNGFSGTLEISDFQVNCTLNTIDTLCVYMFSASRYADDCGPFTDCD
jgi:hypothetical protein